MITQDNLLELKVFQQEFDQKNGLEGHSAGLVFNAMCLAGELGEFVSEMNKLLYDGSRRLHGAREELTDIFVYAIISSNKMNMIPKVALVKGVCDDRRAVYALTEAVGAFCEAVKKHERAKASGSDNQLQRWQNAMSALNQIFTIIWWVSRLLDFDIVDSYYVKMAKNQREVIKYKG